MEKRGAHLQMSNQISGSAHSGAWLVQQKEHKFLLILDLVALTSSCLSLSLSCSLASASANEEFRVD